MCLLTPISQTSMKSNIPRGGPLRLSKFKQVSTAAPVLEEGPVERGSVEFLLRSFLTIKVSCGDSLKVEPVIEHGTYIYVYQIREDERQIRVK